MKIIFLVVIAAVVAFFVIKKIFRTRCTKCITKYTPDLMVVSASELKWEEKEKEKKKHKSTGGALDVNGTNYVEITTTRYRIYYRLVTFTFKCPKCEKVRSYVKKYDLYDSSCGHSQSHNEEIARLRRCIKSTLGKKFVGETTIKIKNIDY